MCLKTAIIKVSTIGLEIVSTIQRLFYLFLICTFKDSELGKTNHYLISYLETNEEYIMFYIIENSTWVPISLRLFIELSQEKSPLCSDSKNWSEQLKFNYYDWY